MKFPVKFTRFLGAGKTPLVGSDSLPKDSGSNPIKATATTDNVLNSRIISMNGWPLQRIALAAKYTGSGSPSALPVAMYVFEDNLQLWIPLAASATTVTPGTASAPQPFVFFDALSLIDFPHVSNDLSSVDPGTPQFLCIVSNSGPSSADGTYDFILGAELTSKPF